MAALNFKMLENVKALDEFCKKHPQQHLVQLNEHESFCPICVEVARRKKNNDLVYQGMLNEYHRNFRDVLKIDSIFDDEDLKQADFSNYEVTEGSEAQLNLNKARQIAGRYLKRDYKANTIITGSPGVGKSHLAVSMLKGVNEHIRPYASCLFISVNELMRLIKSSFEEKGSYYTEAHMVKLLGSVNLLVLDDLGSEASFKQESREASEWVQQVLFGILNKRSRTIITTNLNSQELTKIYNPKLISRLYKGVQKNDAIIKFTEATEDKRKAMF